MRTLIIIVSTLVMLVMAGCDSDQWSGAVYPDRKNILMQKSAGEFNSLEECKAGAMAQLETLGSLEIGYYVCGKNCNNAFEMDCEEKFRGNYYK